MLSLGWGIFMAAAWDFTGWLFGWYSGIPLVPVVVVVAATVLWMYRRAVGALSEAVSGEDVYVRSLVGSVIVVTLSLALLGLKGWNPDWPRYLPPAWKWIRPRAMYRVLILAPVWGGWAMLITCQFCKPTKRTEAAVVAFAAGCGPVIAAVCMAVPLAGAIIYFNYLPWTQLSISAAAIFAAVVGGAALAKRNGGLNRKTLLGVNLMTQIVFILAYLANR